MCVQGRVPNTYKTFICDLHKKHSYHKQHKISIRKLITKAVRKCLVHLSRDERPALSVSGLVTGVSEPYLDIDT